MYGNQGLSPLTREVIAEPELEVKMSVILLMRRQRALRKKQWRSAFCRVNDGLFTRSQED